MQRQKRMKNASSIETLHTCSNHILYTVVSHKSSIHRDVNKSKYTILGISFYFLQLEITRVLDKFLFR